MKTGTFWCWLVGHKFVTIREYIIGGYLYTQESPSKWCIRCGAWRDGV